MSYVVFLLSFLLLAAGLAGGYFSLDLLPTGPGLLYAFGGMVAGAFAIFAWALAILIRRVDRLARIVAQQASPAPPAVYAPPAAIDEPAAEPEAPEVEAATALPETAPAVDLLAEGAPEADEPINENRSGHLPTLAEIEHAIETPEAPPTLIGRYTSGGANYMIFADGSIEAETTDGTFKFPSMGDFKRYLAERREAKG
jgi:hypothetical protein